MSRMYPSQCKSPVDVVSLLDLDLLLHTGFRVHNCKPQVLSAQLKVLKVAGL